jgi:hypothetical protein
MKLVDEDNMISRLSKLRDYLFEPFFKLPAIFRAATIIERSSERIACSQKARHMLFGNSLLKALNDGGLSDASFAYQDGLFFVRRQSISISLSISGSRPTRIKFAILRRNGRSRVNSARFGFSLLFSNLTQNSFIVVLPRHSFSNILDPTELKQHLCRDRTFFAKDPHQNMFGETKRFSSLGFPRSHKGPFLFRTKDGARMTAECDRERQRVLRSQTGSYRNRYCVRKDPCGQCLIFTNEAEKKVLGGDNRRAVLQRSYRAKKMIRRERSE